MSRLEEMGHREELRTRRKIIEAEISSHSDSIRAALPLTGEPEDIPAAPGAPEDVAEEQDRRETVPPRRSPGRCTSPI